MHHYSIIKAVAATFSLSATASAVIASPSTTSISRTSSITQSSSVDVGARILEGLSVQSATDSQSTGSAASRSSSSIIATSPSSSILSSTSAARSNLSSRSSTTTTTASTNNSGIVVPHDDITWSTNFRSSYVSHARSCWSAYTSWYASYPGYFETANISTVTEPYTTSYAGYSFESSSTLYPTASLSTYTLCDGTPRASVSPSTTHFSVTVSFPGDDFRIVSPKTAEQFCTMNQDDCAVAYFGANIQDLQDSYARTRLLGACGNFQDADLGCLVQGGPVQLFYFPEQVEGGDTCGKDGTTVSPTESPQPITTLGTTFQPGSVYLSFSTLYAAYRPSTGLGGEAAQIGPTFSNTILAFRSDEISTNCYAFSENEPTATAQPGFGPGTQLRYADLNSPVAASAYACQNQCRPYEIIRGDDGNITSKSIFPNPCSTIFDNFNPLLAVPTRLREMVPEWSSCSFWNDQNPNIIFDPPTALRQAGQAAGPTLPGVITSTAAAPSVTIPPVVSATGPTQGQPTLPVPSQPGASPTRQSSATPVSTAVPDELPSSPPSAAPQSQQPSSINVPAQPQQPFSATVPSAVPQQSPSANPVVSEQNPTATLAPPQQAPDTPATSAPSSRPPGAGQNQPVVPAPGRSSSSLPFAPSPVVAESQASLLLPDVGSSQNIGDPTTDAATSATIPSALQDTSTSGGSALVLNAGSITFTASAVPAQPGVVEVDGSTLAADASAATVDGHVVSMDNEGVVEVSGTASPGSDSAKITPPSSAITGSRTMANSTTSTFSPLQQVNGAELSRAVHLTSLVCVAVVVTFLRHVL